MMINSCRTRSASIILSFLLAPGITAESVAKDIARLAGLIPAFRNFSKEFGHMLLWAYVSLESGVHISYPGHFGYSEDYDPRKRPWYANAQEICATWTRPLVDVTSGQVIFTVSRRLYRPDGSFWGVAAIDILISEFLQESALSPLWSSEVRSFMVDSAEGATANGTALRILAQKDYQTKAGSWRVGIGKGMACGSPKPEISSPSWAVNGRQIRLFRSAI